jgi:hypothetical protein
MDSNEPSYEKQKAAKEKQIIINLINRLDDRLKNAHYWLTERDAHEQAQEAIMEARGLTLRLSEEYGAHIQFPAETAPSR